MKLTLILGGLSSATILISTLTQWYLFVAIGPGFQTDALFASVTLVQFLLAVISQSLTHVLVPLLTAEDDQQSQQDTWNYLALVGSFFGAIAIALILFSSIWVPLLVPGFSEAGKQLTIMLVRLQLVIMVFAALTGVLTAFYQAQRRFIWPELSGMLLTILASGATILALPRFGVSAFVWTTLARIVVQMLLLLPGVGRFRRPEWNSSRLRETWRRLRPLLIGSTYYKTDSFVDDFLSSLSVTGGLSLLSLGQEVYGIATQIVDRAVVTPIVTLLAADAKAQRWAHFRAVYRSRLAWMIGLVGLGFAVLLVLGMSVLKLLVGYGQVTSNNIQQLWLLMVALIGLPLGGVTGQILASSFYAKGNTTTPTKVGVIGFTIGIFLKIGGFLLFGLIGVALGTTVYYLMNAIILFVLLEREVQHVASA